MKCDLHMVKEIKFQIIKYNFNKLLRRIKYDIQSISNKRQ